MVVEGAALSRFKGAARDETTAAMARAPRARAPDCLPGARRRPTTQKPAPWARRPPKPPLPPQVPQARASRFSRFSLQVARLDVAPEQLQVLPIEVRKIDGKKRSVVRLRLLDKYVPTPEYWSGLSSSPAPRRPQPKHTKQTPPKHTARLSQTKMRCGHGGSAQQRKTSHEAKHSVGKGDRMWTWWAQGGQEAAGAAGDPPLRGLRENTCLDICEFW